MNPDTFGNALGILGGYFAVLLALSVAVETVIEPLSLFRGLRRQVSPDDFLADLRNWLPDGAPAGAKAAAIQAFVAEYGMSLDKAKQNLVLATTVGNEIAGAIGAGAAIDPAKQALVVYMAEIRKKFNIDNRKRIMWLRVLSGAVGVALALLLRLDAFALLKDLFPQGTTIDPVFGTVVTGVTASAGSSFWHDILGRMRTIKEAARSAEGGGT